MSDKTTKNNNFIAPKTDNFFIGLGDAYRIVKRFFVEVWFPPYEFKEVVRQCYQIGYNSLPLISLTGFIVGIVFTNQSRPSLAELGSAAWLPALVAIANVRAKGPLVNA